LRKTINPTAFVIAGAAALFAGLAGNVQAIPISIQDQSNHGGVHFSVQSSHNQSLASPTASVLSGSVLAQNAVGPHNFGPWNFHDSWSFHHGRQGGLTPPSPLSRQDSSSASVPDGGTTAMMMGGVLCGFALLGNKLKI
jgi:hypothetical protein